MTFLCRQTYRLLLQARTLSSLPHQRDKSRRHHLDTHTTPPCIIAQPVVDQAPARYFAFHIHRIVLRSSDRWAKWLAMAGSGLPTRRIEHGQLWERSKETRQASRWDGCGLGAANAMDLVAQEKGTCFQRFSRFLASGETNPNQGRPCKPLATC